jgi:hypothetical protein
LDDQKKDSKYQEHSSGGKPEASDQRIKVQGIAARIRLLNCLQIGDHAVMSNRLSKPLRISGKDLGALRLKDFCARCCWIKYNIGDPHERRFPGIFSSIDSFTKKVTQVHFQKYGKLPPWLEEKFPSARPGKSYHHSFFNLFDPETQITLSGVPDDILELADGTFAILDNKTARYTENQDELLPQYEVQLNAYAMIHEGKGLGNITRLTLIYYEPPEGLMDSDLDGILTDISFAMRFKATCKEIRINHSMVPPLLREVKNIVTAELVPKSNPECKFCKLFPQIASKVSM